MYIYCHGKSVKINFIEHLEQLDQLEKKEIRTLLKRYIESFTQVETKFKTKSHLNTGKSFYSSSKILDFYWKNIMSFSSQEKNLLKIHIQIINKEFPFLSVVPWKFIKLSNDLEKGMPFTLGQFIFLPERMLEDLSENPKTNHVDTLIHEKLHVYQRIYPKVFQSFYKEKFLILLEQQYFQNYIIKKIF